VHEPAVDETPERGVPNDFTDGATVAHTKNPEELPVVRRKIHRSRPPSFLDAYRSWTIETPIIFRSTRSETFNFVRVQGVYEQ